MRSIFCTKGLNGKRSRSAPSVGPSTMYIVEQATLNISVTKQQLCVTTPLCFSTLLLCVVKNVNVARSLSTPPQDSEELNKTRGVYVNKRTEACVFLQLAIRDNFWKLYIFLPLTLATSCLNKDLQSLSACF